MGLLNELARPLPPIPRPHLPKQKSALQRQAERAAELFEVVPRELQPPVDVIARVEAAVGPDGAGLESIRLPELKVVPYVIWGRNPRWRQDRAFVQRFLRLVDALWPRATKRLWRRYIVNFDPESPATIQMAAWLNGRHDDLPDRLRAFSAEFGIFAADRAVLTLARAALSGNRVIEACEGIGLTLAVLRSSGLIASVLEAAGVLLAQGHGITGAPSRLTALLAGRPHNAIAELACPPKQRDRALRAIVDGLVQWQERADAKTEPLEPSVEFLVALNGDPRFAAGRWHGRVADRSIAVLGDLCAGGRKDL
jgi:hypothetical protein